LSKVQRELQGLLDRFSHKFSPYGRYLIVDCQFVSLIFVALAFGNEWQYRTSDSKRFIYDDLATSYKHLVNFRPVTPEFNRVKYAHPSSISSLATFALLLDLAGISTEFSGAITTQSCFTYTLEGVTAMPRGLHARLCHAFLV